MDEHRPVLLREAVDSLVTASSGIYVDATFGRGGHSREILSRIADDSVLICIDKDQEAVRVAEQFGDRRLVVRQGSFIRLKAWVEELGFGGKIRGVLLDLGVSSPQLDNPLRGFSFLRDGPLDMRMDQSQLLSAARWLDEAKESEIEKVLREYGEERFSRRIARAIVGARVLEPIVTTGRLAEIVSSAHPRWEVGKHPATRVFQALRILVNDELGELATGLEQCLEVLSVGGRLVVISFHSLEDRVIKKFLQKHISGGVPEWLPVREQQLARRLRCVEKAIHASSQEVNSNPRSRSAALRIMEKLK